MIHAPLSVLVTGSSDFIGTHVVRHLCEAGHKITGYDLIPPKDSFPDGSIYLCGDIRTDRLPHQGIDAVVHLAALAGVRPSMDRPFDYIATKECPLHLQSTICYPLSPYGPAVFLGLGFLRNKQKCQRPHLALECFRRRIEAGQPVVINGDGSQRRDLTHVSDVARAVELALRWPGSVALNVGTGRNHSVLDMMDAAAKNAAALHFSGSNFTNFTHLLEHQEPHPADVPKTRASLVAVRRELHWTPTVFFPDGPLSEVKKV